jgi:hypothetical protein
MLVTLSGAGAESTEGKIAVTPRVGVDFEHFGETFRVTDTRDTVATINDLGTIVGLTVQSGSPGASSFRLDTDFHYGRQTHRVRLDFEGRLRSGANTWELEHDGSYRVFSEEGDYALSGDYLQDYVRLTWERRLTEALRFRLRNVLDLTWYEDPDEYNLTSTRYRPSADVRFAFGDLSELRAGYELGRRTVPDSTSLNHWRHVGQADLSLLFGWTSSLDVSERIERRVYPEGSVRESSWEHRADITFEFSTGDRTTFRVVQENEVIRYDEPDDLDFDSEWARTGFQVEIHRTRNLDLSLMPVYAFLTSDGAPEEEYTETGLEFGIDWRIGDHTWINLTDEVGRRDYEIGANPVDRPEIDSIASLAADDAFALDTAFSDYVYNRLTLLLTSQVSPGISADLFVNWQPENHHVNRHDTDTRIVSGGFEYRF